MKNLLEILTNEKKSFDFPGYVYVIVLPIALVLLMGIAGWMDTHGM